MGRPPKNPAIPSRQGVSASCIALPCDKPAPWPQLIDFLAERPDTRSPTSICLKIVDPVVLGKARAKQDQLGDRERTSVLPLLIHGDAAFAAQGVVMELNDCAFPTLNKVVATDDGLLRLTL